MAGYYSGVTLDRPHAAEAIDDTKDQSFVKLVSIKNHPQNKYSSLFSTVGTKKLLAKKGEDLKNPTAL